MAEPKADSRPPDKEAWDYRVIEVGIMTDAQAETVLADLGDEHWELVCVEAGKAYLKRSGAKRPGT